MRTVALLMLIAAACSTEGPFGTWRMDPGRSTFTGDFHPKGFTVRLEPHAHGEVFTLDTISWDGRATTSSTILYFDGKPRDFQEPSCSGTQSSRRVDDRTVEILRICGSGARTRFLRRLAEPAKEMILDITEQQPDGRRFERRLVLEKQSGVGTTQDR